MKLPAEKIISRMLRLRATYDLVNWLAMRRVRTHPLNATKMMTKFGIELTKRAFVQPQKTIWTNVFAPTEIIYAMDLVPFSPETAAAIIASLGASSTMLSKAEASWYSTDTCSFHRCALGAALFNYFPEPAALVCTGHICDSAVRFFANAAKLYNKPFYLIDTPYFEGPAALEYLTRQMMGLVEFLEKHTGSKLNPKQLRKAIEWSNEARKYMLAVNELRKRKPCPMIGRDGISYVYMIFLGQGAPETVEIYKTLARELESSTVSHTENHRLIWLHLKPYYPSQIFNLLEEELGAIVVMEEMTHVYWPEIDPDNPYEGLARKAMAHFGYGNVSRRTDTIVRLAREYDADGVIHFSHWGCRQNCGGIRMLKDQLKLLDVPFLDLQGDCIDARSYSEGQVRTRIEAFVETLRQRKFGSNRMSDSPKG